MAKPLSLYQGGGNTRHRRTSFVRRLRHEWLLPRRAWYGSSWILFRMSRMPRCTGWTFQPPIGIWIRSSQSCAPHANSRTTSGIKDGFTNYRHGKPFSALWKVGCRALSNPLRPGRFKRNHHRLFCRTHPEPDLAPLAGSSPQRIGVRSHTDEQDDRSLTDTASTITSQFAGQLPTIRALLFTDLQAATGAIPQPPAHRRF